MIQNDAPLPARGLVRASLSSLAARAPTTLIRRKGDAGLVAARLVAREAGAAFRLAFLPRDHRGGARWNRSGTAMAALFEARRAPGLTGGGWIDRPPILADRRDLDPALRPAPASLVAP